MILKDILCVLSLILMTIAFVYVIIERDTCRSDLESLKRTQLQLEEFKRNLVSYGRHNSV